MKKCRWLGFVFGLAVFPVAVLGQRDGDNEPLDRCESTRCFNQLHIRDFEVIDNTTLIVYVGQQECPFLVEMTGTFCDLTFLPGNQVVFRPSNTARSRSAPVVGGIGTNTDGRGPIEQPRVCASSLNMGIPSGPFTSSIGGDVQTPNGLVCMLRTVRALTDDERLELYVDKEFVPPPPPFGTGRVESPENPSEPVVEPEPPREESARERRRRERAEARARD